MLLRNKKHLNRGRRLALAAGIAAMFGASASMAATITVDAVSDLNDPADGNCELREAVAAANTDTAVDTCAAGDMGADNINFANNLAFLNAAAIILTNGEIVISNPVSLEAVGATAGNELDITLDGNDTSRIFNIASGAGNVSLTGFALTNARATNANGGAISNAATLSLTGCDITSSDATGTAGAAQGSGGAIFNGAGGVLTITDGSMNLNTAERAGGAIEEASGAAAGTAAVTISGTTFNGNTTGATNPSPGNGGVLHVTGSGDISITDASMVNNTAASEGGALWNGGGTMTVTNTTIDANIASGADATNGGGGIFNNATGGAGTVTLMNATITNNLADGAAGSGGGIFNNDGGTVNVTGGSINTNQAVRAGGGIEIADDSSTATATLLILTDVTMNGNDVGVTLTPAAPGNGGGVHVGGAGTTNINGGTFSNNMAAQEGGGLWNGSGIMTIAASATGSTSITGNSGLGDAADDGGGGIFNNGGTVDSTDANITTNSAPGIAGSGGGILVNDGGVLVVSGGNISNNTSVRAGGGIEVRNNTSTTLTAVTMDANSTDTIGGNNANPGNGGALHVTGTSAASTVTVNDSTISNNIAAQEGGGLWNFGADTASALSVMNVNNSTIMDNTGNGPLADDGGGGLFNNGGQLNVTGSMISGNTAPGASGSGGGLLNNGGILAVMDSVISANSASRAGGGIENAAGTVNLTRVTLGGITEANGNTTGDAPGNGGGLHTGGAGTVTVDDSTVANNVAEEGGGLWNSGAGSLTVSNSTVSTNTAEDTAADTSASTVGAGAGGGGGIFQLSGATASTTLINTTVASNSASLDGGGVQNAGTATVTLSNSLVGDNTATGAGNDAAGSFSANFSLIEDAMGATISGANNLNGDAALEMLAMNGGTTATHALPSNSSAVDAADNSVCANDPINNLDQRAVTRDFDGDGDGSSNCDIGAFEFTNAPVVTAMNNSLARVDAAPGDTDVQALAFTFTNDSGEDVSVDGFSGSVSGDGNIAADIDDARVYLDANADGQVDAGDTELTNGNGATITLNAGMPGFSVAFSPARSIAFGDSENYLVVIDIAGGSTTTTALSFAPLFAGGLALLPLIGLGGFGWRRTRWMLAVVVLGVTLAGCGSGGGGGGGNNPPIEPGADFQFSLTQVSATGDTSGTDVIASPLPLNGPAIFVSQ